MKVVLIVLLSQIFAVCLGQDTVSTVLFQDTVFFDKEGDEISSFDTCYTYEVISYYSKDSNNVLVEEYFRSTQIRSRIAYNPYEKHVAQGEFEQWYDGGQLKEFINYRDGQYDGSLITYWPNGQQKRSDVYQDGEFVSGQTWDSLGVETDHYVFMIMPEFPRGDLRLLKYLRKTVEYPKEAQKRAIQGRVIIEFVIDRIGDVTDVKVLEGAHPLLDTEAIRVVEQMPRWKPGMRDGELVRVSYRLPINFSLR